MDDRQILDQIKTLVDREHAARQQAAQGLLGRDEEQAQIRDLERALDQCWDLLRQRRARQEFHQDPDDARPRPPQEIQDYRQ